MCPPSVFSVKGQTRPFFPSYFFFWSTFQKVCVEKKKQFSRPFVMSQGELEHLAVLWHHTPRQPCLDNFDKFWLEAVSGQLNMLNIHFSSEGFILISALTTCFCNAFARKIIIMQVLQACENNFQSLKWLWCWQSAAVVACRLNIQHPPVWSEASHNYTSL